MAADRITNPQVAQLYAQALVAIARADDQIGLEEGARLQQRIAARTGLPIVLDDLLLDETVEPDRLAEFIRGATDPFRNDGLHPGELAAMIITDGVSVVLAKGYVSEAEAREIVRFATALGCSIEEVRRLCQQVAPRLGALV